MMQVTDIVRDISLATKYEEEYENISTLSYQHFVFVIFDFILRDAILFMREDNVLLVVNSRI